MKLTDDVGAVLARYVHVHDVVYKFNWRKVLLIPGLFRAIDYGSLQPELDDVLRKLKGCSAATQRLARRERSGDHTTRMFLDLMQPYLAALRGAVQQLREICGNLTTRADGSSRYTMQRFKGDSRHYDSAVVIYTELGRRVNDVGRRI